MIQVYEKINNEPQIETLDTVSAVKQAIDANLARIHGEPDGHNARICAALMIGAPALVTEVQV